MILRIDARISSILCSAAFGDRCIPLSRPATHYFLLECGVFLS